MMTRDGFNRSFWQSKEDVKFSTDSDDLAFDTIIVGAGITGITLAKELQNRGVKCLLLDKKILGSERRVVPQHISTIFMMQLILRYGINCDFSSCDFFLYSAEEGQDDQLEQIYAAHQELGLATYGSRFDVDGNMLNGPATTGLSKLDID